MQTFFTILITLQFLVILLHDCLHIPGWTHGRQVRAAIGPRKFWIATAINALFPALAVAYAIYFLHRPAPRFVISYWSTYCGITLLFAITMWYLPYFFGASRSSKDLYARMYAGTRHLLPSRGDNLRPNLLHLCFHVLFIATFSVSLALLHQAAQAH